MHELSMGIDDREVIPHHLTKSIGHEETFSRDILNVKAAKKELLSLADRVAHRMRRKEAVGKTVTLKVKYSDFRLITRAVTLAEPTDDGPAIYSECCKLLEKTAVGKRPVRLLGISLSQLNFLGTGDQPMLFGKDEASRKRDGLHKALDTLVEKHGKKSIRPGTLLDDC
jgi:DNA polymerase-4